MEGAYDEPPADDLADYEKAIPVDCGSFQVDKRSFIVIDGLYPAKLAEARLGKLAAKGLLTMGTVPTDCLHSWPAPGRTAVWTGLVYPSRPSAKAGLRKYEQSLKELGVEATANARIVKVRPG